MVNWKRCVGWFLPINWKNWLIKNLAIVMLGATVAVGVFMTSHFYCYYSSWSNVWLSWVGSIVLLVSTIVMISGFKSVPQEQRWVIEMFGAYSRTLKPGLSWLFPLLEKVRSKVSVWTQKVALFERPIKIDFVDGSATPKDAAAFIRSNLFLLGDPNPSEIMPVSVAEPNPVLGPEEPVPIAPPNPSDTADNDAPRRMVYAVEDFRKAVIGLLENAVRSCLNGMTIDEALPKGRGGYNIAQQIPGSDLNGVRDQLRVWGVRLERITIGDFDLDEAVIKARESVTIAGKAAVAAGSEMQRATTKSMGVILEAIGQLHGFVFSDDEHSEKSGKVDVERVREWLKKPNNASIRKWVMEQSQDLVKRNFSLDKGALLDIRVPAGTGLGGIGAAIASILSRGFGGAITTPSVAVDNQKDVGDMTFEELAEAAKERRKKRGKKEE